LLFFIGQFGENVTFNRFPIMLNIPESRNFATTFRTNCTKSKKNVKKKIFMLHSSAKPARKI